ncbi:MAG TPA: hypothetical protein P5255_02985, partial [Phycisphaerae bacterium]|nr:hypothetical protein [Phycisphaerae bacterium]HRT40901.1 hypothetical protein [Phycisphaerae bacterium]
MTLPLDTPMPKVSVARGSELASYANVRVPAASVTWYSRPSQAILVDCDIWRRTAVVNTRQPP